MAITYGFYNSKDGDRKYYARQVSKIVDSLVKDGIFMHIGNHLNVIQGTGMQVLIEPGFAWFNHTWTENDADYPLTIEESDLLQPRIDAIVLEVDESLTVRANAIKVIKGTPASKPQKPTLTNTAEVHQYPLAYVSVAVGVTEITNANIENRIGMEDCPFVTGVLETINIDTLIQEWEAQFDEWFKSLEDTLSGDVAGNLLVKIQENEKTISDLRRSLSYQYGAVLRLDAWAGSAGNYTQTVQLRPTDGGGPVKESSRFASPPMCGQVNNAETREKLLAALSLINNSYCVLGDDTVTVSGVSDRPSVDIEVLWDIKNVGIPMVLTSKAGSFFKIALRSYTKTNFEPVVFIPSIKYVDGIRYFYWTVAGKTEEAIEGTLSDEAALYAVKYSVTIDGKTIYCIGLENGGFGPEIGAGYMLMDVIDNSWYIYHDDITYDLTNHTSYNPALIQAKNLLYSSN